MANPYKPKHRNDETTVDIDLENTRLREALEFYVKLGHRDTCDAGKLIGYQCNCGYWQAKAALRGGKP